MKNPQKRNKSFFFPSTWLLYLRILKRGEINPFIRLVILQISKYQTRQDYPYKMSKCAFSVAQNLGESIDPFVLERTLREKMSNAILPNRMSDHIRGKTKANPFRISGDEKRVSYQGQKRLLHSNAVKEKPGKTGLKGFEPLTCGLRVRRYAKLSYRPTLVRPSNVVDNAE